jgi:uncharacterized RDD family membrane protein YckC
VTVYSDFRRRLYASAIDLFFVGLAMLGLRWVLDRIAPGWYPDPLVVLLAPIAFCWLYFAIAESSRWQATPGKRAMDIHVTDGQGRRLTFARASARWLAKVVTALLFGIGFVLIARTERKRGLHDWLADTLISRTFADAPHDRIISIPAHRPGADYWDGSRWTSR